MKSQFTAGLVATLLLLNDHVSGLNLPITGQRRIGRHRHRRAAGGFGLDDASDFGYFVNISMNGLVFQALIDTGSSDLIVAGSVPHSIATGHNATVPFVGGTEQGPVSMASATLAGLSVPDQMYFEIAPDEMILEGQGLIGLGPSNGSQILTGLKTPSAAPMIDRLLSQNSPTKNFISILLGRSEDPSMSGGNITIGELLDGYEDIENQPRIPVTMGPNGFKHFQVLLDEDGLIGPNGKAIPMTTQVNQTKNKSQVTGGIDTGFSLAQVPSYVAEAIYGDFKGAEFLNNSVLGPIWGVPCSTEVNLAVKIGGRAYPIHPLDMTIDPTTLGSNVTNSEGEPLCFGSLQPIIFSDPSIDMIIGMPLLRNLYFTAHYGNLIVGTADKEDPYMQFLSITDPVGAHFEFVAVRLGDKNSTYNSISARSESEQHKTKSKLELLAHSSSRVPAYLGNI